MSNYKPYKKIDVNGNLDDIKYDADFIDDTNSTHKFVSTNEKNTWNGKIDSSVFNIIELVGEEGTLSQSQYESITNHTLISYKATANDTAIILQNYGIIEGAWIFQLYYGEPLIDGMAFIMLGISNDYSWGAVTKTEKGYTKTTIDSFLSGKQPTITGAATTITSNDLTASKILASDLNGKVSALNTSISDFDIIFYGFKYSSSKTYSQNDICLYNGTLYASLSNSNTGNLPTNTTYWIPVLVND